MVRNASQQERPDHMRDVIKDRAPRFREIFDLTEVSVVRAQTGIWRGFELESLPAGRVIPMGDAAHVMIPFRGEGGYNTFIDAIKLGENLNQVNSENSTNEIITLRGRIEGYNTEMLERGRNTVKLSRQLVDGTKVKQKQPLQAPMRVVPFKELPTELAAV
ncbi:FAD binding domain [Fusarium longipes]|uniref:FAD binding domain n=1 Tax=Fusarium longipes TaxID=694270 RepID=A0A395T3X0_9HYPO|nr:FAD binding domain [Fusarium longipes]